MRLIDADALFKAFEGAMWYDNMDRDDVAEDLLLNAPTIELPPNEPLTADELLKMNGEPVWWVSPYGKSRWMLVCVDADDVWIEYGRKTSFLVVKSGELFELNVIAIYRRKPDSEDEALT